MSYNPSNRTKLFPSSSPITSQFSTKSRVSLTFPDRSPFTRQEFRDESDINTIMGRYLRTGELPHVNLIAPQYFDSEGVDFQAHMQVIAEAKTLFARLPSAIRSQFYNDPAHFVDYCSNPANRVDLAHMGLLSPSATREALNPEPPTAPASSRRVAPPAASAPLPQSSSGSNDAA